MTTSGSQDFSMYQSDIINDAAAIANIRGIGQTLSADDYVACQTLLNAFVKAITSQSTLQSRGLKLWARKRATLFLQDSQYKYQLGAGGDHASAACHNTTLSAAEAVGQTTISVTSVTGISDGDYIGIVCDDNTVHWSTVNGTPSTGTVVITDALDAAAASGNRVYTYTTIIQRPLKVLSVLLRDSSGNDVPLSEIDLGQYENISNKTQETTPLRYYAEAQLDTFDLYLDGYPSSTSKTLEIVYLRPFEDFDSTDDTPDFPQEWYETLLYGLAKRICVAYGKPLSPELDEMAKASLAQANMIYPETSSLFFEPDRPL